MNCKNKKCAAELAGDAKFCHRCGRKQFVSERTPKSRGNGQGSVYREGNTWTATAVKYYYTDDDGKRRPKRPKKKGFKTKKEALAYLPILANSKEKKVSTLDDHWKVYVSASLPKLSESKQTAYNVARKKMDDIFYKQVDLLTIEELQDCVDNNATSYYTARDMKTVLSHLYKRAMAQQEVTINLSNFIELPVLVEKESEPFTKEEQESFWELYAQGDEFVPYILLMIHTGMMPGELLKAYKSMIDWEERKISGGGIKTKKRKETPIVLKNIIIPVLRRICELSKGDKLIHIGKDKFYDEYYACLERASVRKLPPYSCRHSTGTALGTSAIPLLIAKEIMRHAKVSSTEKYSHPDVSELLEAANNMEGLNNQ